MKRIHSALNITAVFSLSIVLILAIPNLAQTAPAETGSAQRTRAQKAPAAQTSPAPDLTRQPTLYVVGYAHLDTQWRWEYPQVLKEYLPATLDDNFALFEKYPHYIFNFSGANRYRLMKEYYPAGYARMKRYVAAGRWFPAGSSMEESDVNSPSAESIFRQVLYGNQFFRKEFNQASSEYMLPDCFGFPASLPSILAHAGIKGFSTQKLTWGSAAPVGGPDSTERTPAGTPFNVGVWQGPDGHQILAAFNPGSYSADVTTDLSKPLPPPAAEDPSVTPQQRGFRELMRYQDDWAKRVVRNGQVSGLYTDYHYYGTGDIGGAPREASVKLMEALVTRGRAALPDSPAENGAIVGDGPVKVISATAEQMFLDIAIKPGQMARLPRYTGELELTNHSAGSLTSQAYQKRWNRKNELLADAAEKASLAAEWLGGPAYPQRRLNDAWTLVMGGQFHDIMAGTATPKSYEFSWNDDVLAMNQFAGVLSSAMETVGAVLDTQITDSQTKDTQIKDTQAIGPLGKAIIVYNPLNIARQDVVEASVSYPGGAPVPKSVRVLSPDGKEVTAQMVVVNDGAGGDGAVGDGTSQIKILFLADVPSVGFAVYHLQPDVQMNAQPPDRPASSPGLAVTESSLENARYRLKVDGNGDVASIFDKSADRELLAAPARLAFMTEKPFDWPAWNMDWADQQKPPRGFVSGPAKIKIIESGPVRVALEITREAEGSRFVQTIRLSAGEAGDRVEFWNAIDWKTKEAALKASFPLTVANPLATYNWDVGAIQRGNNDEKKFEVASHQWFDLTSPQGDYGVTVLSDCKYGSDKPDDSTLRLTLLYTPGLGKGNGRDYEDQTSQDWGHHEFVYGLAGHKSGWRQAQTDWQAYQLNQPLIAFESTQHPGALGKKLSLVTLSDSRVRVLALKKAEQGNEWVLRIVELDGKPAAPAKTQAAKKAVRIRFAAPVTAAREVDAQEFPIGPARVANGELVASLSGYEPRTFAVQLAPPQAKARLPRSQPVALKFDEAVASAPGSHTSSGFDAEGRSYPAELLPAEMAMGGIPFALAAAEIEKPNALAARGQTIELPAGEWNRIYLLAAASNGDQRATFAVGERPAEITVQDWGGYIGQWDNRIWTTRKELAPLGPGDPAPFPVSGAPPPTRTVSEYAGMTPGFIKPASVAWFASHRHTKDGQDEPYSYSYLFVYPLDVPMDAKTLTLPNNSNVHILAITVANQDGSVRAAQPLVDTRAAQLLFDKPKDVAGN